MKLHPKWKVAGAWILAFAIVLGIKLGRTASVGPDAEVLAIGLQSDGRAVLGGRFGDSRIQRRNPDGSPDTTFGHAWSVGGFNAAVFSLAIQSDDRIVAGGEFTNFDASLMGYIARLNPDGSLDTTFARGIGTGFDAPVLSVASLADGRILAAGHFTSFNGTRVGHVARLLPTGTLDTTFNSGSGFDGPVHTIAVRDGAPTIFGGAFNAYRDQNHRSLASVGEDGAPVELGSP